MTRPVQAPENVRILLKDGTTIACEIYYQGTDSLGQRVWMVTAETPPPEEIDCVTCDLLPAHTSLRFRFRDQLP